jgi:hypothetical protein
MANTYGNIIALGKLTVTAAGATLPLSTNSGSLGGSTVGSTISPPTSGRALREIQLFADKANTGQIFVLPRGNTAAANPGNIIAVLVPGSPVSLPRGVSDAAGMLPENFVLDTDTAGQVAYGCGFTG